MRRHDSDCLSAEESCRPNRISNSGNAGLMSAKLKAAVLGVTGYSGFELARILLGHPRLDPPLLMSRSDEKDSSARNGSRNLADVFPVLSGNGGYPLHTFSWDVLKQHGVELLFLATPHEVSRSLVPEAMSRGIRVIDLSGAWRLKQTQHKAIYGLPELNGDHLANAILVANPGCYATSVILALAPLLRAGVVDRERGIVSDSKSGVSGAGKEPSSRTHFVSVADNLSAYSVFGHRHVGEILEQLELNTSELIFTPHLLPIPRGILSTLYVHLNREMKPVEVESCFREFYAGKRWVRLFATPQLPEIQFSLHTNYCDLGFCLAEDGRRLVLVSCVDNLLKGAAGQVVQNMNLMYVWKEEEGLQ